MSVSSVLSSDVLSPDVLSPLDVLSLLDAPSLAPSSSVAGRGVHARTPINTVKKIALRTTHSMVMQAKRPLSFCGIVTLASAR